MQSVSASTDFGKNDKNDNGDKPVEMSKAEYNHQYSLVEIKSQHSSDTSVEIHIIYPPTSSERFKETSPHQNSSLQYTIKNQVNVISKSTSSGSMSSRIIEHIHTHTNTSN
ncbi:hypothetical protein PV328_004139 [Microctonus aethiopoides]|uniref:Uncharacterized protein n=1 Tax=Microctonus aethiopoides TaxID=144406 RepID=A0AA39F9V5_9HYME|nr:hypothetical protein PV328_004139 [Microctonus aethiopoides]